MFTSIKTEWAYTTEAIVVSCKTEAEARLKVREEYRFWAELATRFGVARTWIKYPRCKRNGFEVLASMASSPSNDENKELRMFDGEKIFPILETANGLPMSPGILKALETIAANPDDRWVLLRLEQDLSAQVQIAMTESMQACIVGANIKQALNRDRSEYFHPQDLIEVKRQTRQNETFTTSWRGFSPVNPLSPNWRLFTYSYSIVEAANNFIWQLGRNIDVQPIAAPASARTPL